MSYILEALKKAQAERQLGALPTIHATSLQGDVGGDTGSKLKKPLLLALISMAALIVVLLALVWRQSQQPVAISPMMPAPATVSATVAPSLPPLLAAPQPMPLAVQQPAQTGPAAVPAPPPALARAPALASTPVPASSPAPAPASAPVATAAAAPPPSDDNVPSLRELPEPIQRAIPPITVGGYIYSRNPADRLLLIDKVLRHEGEELSPGFVLEKLQPKAAIFNYKGYRYRVGY